MCDLDVINWLFFYIKLMAATFYKILRSCINLVFYVSDFDNINKRNNNLSPQLTEHKTDESVLYWKPYSSTQGSSPMWIFNTIQTSTIFSHIILYVFIYTICLCKQAGPIVNILDWAKESPYNASNFILIEVVLVGCV